MKALDFQWIAPNLAQGSFPSNDPSLLWSHFDVVVYMAMPEEGGQPDVLTMPGKKVLRAPIDDRGAPISETEERRVRRVLPEVVSAVRSGKRVLVSCMHGRNRSGLVVGLAMRHLYPSMEAQKVVQHIRERRKALSGPALTNRRFVQRIVSERP